VDVGEEDVLEPIVAVEACSVLADLDEPGPDLVGGALIVIARVKYAVSGPSATLSPGRAMRCSASVAPNSSARDGVR